MIAIAGCLTCDSRLHSELASTRFCQPRRLTLEVRHLVLECPGAVQPGRQLPRWQRSGAGLGMALLMARDPILFYAEVPLYESELDDNGSSQLSVKVAPPVRLQSQEWRDCTETRLSAFSAGLTLQGQ